MSRPHHRVSRPLILLLVAIVAAGAISIGYHVYTSRPASAATAAPDQNTPSTQPSVAVAPSGPAPALLAAASDANISNSSPLSATTTQPSADAANERNAVQAATILPPSGTVTPATSPSAALLTDTPASVSSGDELAARTRVNAALQSGTLNAEQTAQAKQMLSKISQDMIFSPKRFPDDPYGGVYVVQSGDSLRKLAAAHDLAWEFLGRINGIDAKHLRVGATIKVVQGPFFAVVDKKMFTMDIYLGGLPGEKSCLYVTTMQVGLGKDDSTPTGIWIIEPHHKLKHPTYYSPRGEGVIAADDPKNPLGGYWIGLTGTTGQALGKMSYGIHGTIDQDSVGKQSSMGCIRLRTADIALVYDLMVEGKSLVKVQE